MIAALEDSFNKFKTEIFSKDYKKKSQMTSQEAEKKPLMSAKVYLLDISGNNKKLWTKEILKIVNERTIPAQLEAFKDKLVIQFTAFGTDQIIFKAFGNASFGLTHLISTTKSDMINIPGIEGPVPTITLKFENHGKLKTINPQIQYIQIILALPKENSTDQFIIDLTNIAKSASIIFNVGSFNSGFNEEEPYILTSFNHYWSGLFLTVLGGIILISSIIVYLSAIGSFAFLIQIFTVFGIIIGVILLIIGGILYFQSLKFK